MANTDTIDKITSWAASKYATAPTVSGGTGIMNSDGTGSGTMFKSQAAGSSSGLAPTVSGGTGVMNSDGSGSGTMYKSQPNSGPPTAVTKPAGLLDSPATTAVSKTDYTSQINDLYRTTLKRDGDAAGIKWYSDNINSGATTLDGVRNALVGSDEYRAANNVQAPVQMPTPTSLTARTVDPSKETAQGQLGGLLDSDNLVLQQARAEGQRTAFDRGLGNSTMAASAGADAMIRAATNIATSDAATYGKAADYNTAAQNEQFMYDRDQVNQFKKLEAQLGSEAAARVMQIDLAKMQDATSRYNTDTNAATQANAQKQQMTVAQMQDQTTRWQQEQQNANSRYNTDASYRQQIDSQKQSMANNIVQNMEMSPDRKAAMLEALGFGTSAKQNGAGLITPGTGLAGAVYVIDSVGEDLNFAKTVGTQSALESSVGGMF